MVRRGAPARQQVALGSHGAGRLTSVTDGDVEMSEHRPESGTPSLADQVPVDDGHADDCGPTSPPETVLPSGSLIASLRGEVPTEPLDALIPYVEPTTSSGTITDWLLTSDVIAFGDVDIPQLYLLWRSRWIRSWPLESLASIRALHETCELLLPGDAHGDWHERIGAVLATGGPDVIPVDDLASLQHATEALRDVVRERDARGFGIVDATPGRTIPGLAAAWSAQCPSRLFARDRFMDVWLTRDRGLVIRTTGPSRHSDGLSVTDVVVTSESVVVRSDTEEWELVPEQARPLSWLVPGATRWRVREVPEVIVWSRSFAGLPEACEQGIAHDLPIHLTVDPPVLPVSTGDSPA